MKNDVEKPCETCYCMKGHIVCAVQECAPTPLEKINCTAVPPEEGQCCPSMYECDNISGDLSTTEQYGITMVPIGNIPSEAVTENDVDSTEEPSIPTEKSSGVGQDTTVKSDRSSVSTESASEVQSTTSSNISEEGVTTSKHDDEQRPTIASESQVTTIEPEEENKPETEAQHETTSEAIKPTEKQEAAIPITTDDTADGENPSSDDIDYDHDKDINEQSATTKNNESVTSEPTTASQIIEEHSSTESVEVHSETNDVNIENEQTSTTVGYATSKSASQTDESVTQSTQNKDTSETTTQHLNPQESSEDTVAESVTPSSNGENTPEAASSKVTTESQYSENEIIQTTLSLVSEGDSPKVTTESQNSANEHDTIQTTLTSVSEKSQQEITEKPIIPDHISESEKESNKPSGEDSTSFVPEENSTEGNVESNGQQTEQSSESEEKMVTKTTAQSELTTSKASGSEETSENEEKSPESIGTSTPKIIEGITEEQKSDEEITESATGKAVVTENASHENIEPEPTTEKIVEVSSSTESESAEVHSEQYSTDETPIVTEKSNNENEVIDTTEGKEISSTETPVTIVDRLPEITSDDIATEKEKEVVTESIETTENEISASSESSITHADDENTNFIKPEGESQSTESSVTESVSSSTEALPQSPEIPVVTTETHKDIEQGTTLGKEEESSENVQPITTEQQGTEKTYIEISSTEAIVPDIIINSSSEKPSIHDDNVEIYEDSTTEGGTDRTDIDISTTGATVFNKASEEPTSHQDDVEIYEASIAPETEEPEKLSTELPISITSPKSEEQTTKQSQESFEITEDANGKASSDIEKSSVTTESEQDVDVKTEKSESASSESPQTAEPKVPSTTVEGEASAKPVQTTTESIESPSETTEERLVPGEGSCLVDGITYENNAHIDPINQCQVSCQCVNSIVKCESVTCDPPTADLENCMAVYPGPDSCCPIYNCGEYLFLIIF